ncbi:hypothetical protein KUC55_03515 [Pseudomonas aeruginosa]|uniref:hypothetical protein n=1 Tax=Pseudomonas aeruginosa TaxID=287 RepID=UPI0021E18501|nr:hypothetical protein [Pseudomonas aeruginosa]MCV0304741.1 hypothetical protein [Pseudomonas aeruginosa]
MEIDSIQYSASLISSMLLLAKIVIFCVGLIILISSLVNMIRAGAEGSKITWGSIATALVASALLMNTDQAISTVGNTYFNKPGAEQICFIVAEKGIDDSCFSNELSGITGQLENRIRNMSGDSTVEAFAAKTKIVVGILQLIGFIYFGIGAYGLTQVSKGSANYGYGKPLTTMLASALIVDIPHTVQSFIDTLNKIGIQF